MNLLQKPSEITSNGVLSGLFYGQPGVGKSTLALSAPNPVFIDTENGAKRVERRLLPLVLPATTYQAVLDLLASDEVKPFDTLVFDTLARLVDRMIEYLGKQNPKNLRSPGNPTQQGWGAVKQEFIAFLRTVKNLDKHLIFVAHEKEDKDGENRILRPDAPGNGWKEMLKDLDFMGYVSMKSGKRTVSFTPEESFYAKNSLKLPAYIEIPNTDNHPNDFIQREIIDRTIVRMKEDAQLVETYNALKDGVSSRIVEARDADAVNALRQEVRDGVVIWDSKIFLGNAIKERAKELGLVYDKATDKFTAPVDILAAIKKCDNLSDLASLQKSAPADKKSEDAFKARFAELSPAEAA